MWKTFPQHTTGIQWKATSTPEAALKEAWMWAAVLYPTLPPLGPAFSLTFASATSLACCDQAAVSTSPLLPHCIAQGLCQGLRWDSYEWICMGEGATNPWGNHKQRMRASRQMLPPSCSLLLQTLQCLRVQIIRSARFCANRNQEKLKYVLRFIPHKSSN